VSAATVLGHNSGGVLSSLGLSSLVGGPGNASGGGSVNMVDVRPAQSVIMLALTIRCETSPNSSANSGGNGNLLSSVAHALSGVAGGAEEGLDATSLIADGLTWEDYDQRSRTLSNSTANATSKSSQGSATTTDNIDLDLDDADGIAPSNAAVTSAQSQSAAVASAAAAKAAAASGGKLYLIEALRNHPLWSLERFWQLCLLDNVFESELQLQESGAVPFGSQLQQQRKINSKSQSQKSQSQNHDLKLSDSEREDGDASEPSATTSAMSQSNSSNTAVATYLERDVAFASLSSLMASMLACGTEPEFVATFALQWAEAYNMSDEQRLNLTGVMGL